MGRRPPLPPESLSADGQKFYDLLNEADDVAMIIVGIGYIDACLGSLLHKRLKKGAVSDNLLDAKGGPLGSFWARSSLAYALALIDKPMYRDLLVLAELRNEVAHHHFALSFDTPAVSEKCNALMYAAGLKDGATGNPLMEATWLSTPRNRLMLTATMVANRILLTALSTRHADHES